jgi:hypothetical protein
MSNVYDLLDKELERLHRLLLALQAQDSGHGRYGEPGVLVWERIIHIQDFILKSYQANDQALQEKIAEGLLLGGSGKGDEGINPSSK